MSVQSIAWSDDPLGAYEEALAPTEEIKLLMFF